MTHHPDDSFPEDTPEGGSGSGPGEGGYRKLDEDAAWRSIVEHYGERADISDLPPVEDVPSSDSQPSSAEPAENRFPSFDRRWEPERLNTEATWEEEGHFIPPDPPPPPLPEPRRRLAWSGLFGAPLLMLVAVVFGWTFPGWISFLLLVGFVGGFGYLVATMPRHRGGPGDDGAVV